MAAQPRTILKVRARAVGLALKSIYLGCFSLFIQTWQLLQSLAQ